MASVFIDGQEIFDPISTFKRKPIIFRGGERSQSITTVDEAAIKKGETSHESSSQEDFQKSEDAKMQETHQRVKDLAAKLVREASHKVEEKSVDIELQEQPIQPEPVHVQVDQANPLLQEQEEVKPSETEAKDMGPVPPVSKKTVPKMLKKHAKSTFFKKGDMMLAFFTACLMLLVVYKSTEQIPVAQVVPVSREEITQVIKEQPKVPQRSEASIRIINNTNSF